MNLKELEDLKKQAFRDKGYDVIHFGSDSVAIAHCPQKALDLMNHFAELVGQALVQEQKGELPDAALQEAYVEKVLSEDRILARQLSDRSVTRTSSSRRRLRDMKTARRMVLVKLANEAFEEGWRAALRGVKAVVKTKVEGEP